MLIDALGRKLTANLRRRTASPAINSGQRATPLMQQTQAVASSGPGLTDFLDDLGDRVIRKINGAKDYADH